MESAEVQRTQEIGFGEPDLDCLLLKVPLDIELITEILGKTTTLELADGWTIFRYKGFMDSLVTQLTKPPWIILVPRFSFEAKADFRKQLADVTKGRVVVTEWEKKTLVSECRKTRGQRDKLTDHIVRKPKTVTLLVLLKALSQMSKPPQHLYVNQFGQKILVENANGEFPWMEKLLQNPEAKFRVDVGFLLQTPNGEDVTLFSRGQSDTTVHDSRDKSEKLLRPHIYKMFNTPLGSFSCIVGSFKVFHYVKMYPANLVGPLKSILGTCPYMSDAQRRKPAANATLRRQLQKWFEALDTIDTRRNEPGPGKNTFRVEVSVNYDASEFEAHGDSFAPKNMQEIVDKAAAIGSFCLSSGRVQLSTADWGALIQATRQTFETLHASPYCFGTGANNNQVSKRMLGYYFVLMNAIGLTLSKYQETCQQQILTTCGEEQEGEEEVGLPADQALEKMQRPSGARPLPEGAPGSTELELIVMTYCEIWNPHRNILAADLRCVDLNTQTAFKFNDPARKLPSMATKEGLCKAVVLYLGTTWHNFLLLKKPRGSDNRQDFNKEAPTAQMVETEISEKVRSVLNYSEPPEDGSILLDSFDCQSKAPLNTLWKRVTAAGESPFLLPMSCTAPSLDQSFPFPQSAVLSSVYSKWRKLYEWHLQQQPLSFEPPAGANSFWHIMVLDPVKCAAEFSAGHSDQIQSFNLTPQSCEVPCVTCEGNLMFTMRKNTPNGKWWLNTVIPTLPCKMGCGFTDVNPYHMLTLAQGAPGFYVPSFENLLQFGVDTTGNSSGFRENKEAHLFYVYPSLEIPTLLQLRQNGWVLTCKTKNYLLNTSEYFYATFKHMYCMVEEGNIENDRWPDVLKFLVIAKRSHVLQDVNVYFSKDTAAKPLGVWFKSVSGVRLHFDARCLPQDEDTVKKFLNNVMDLKDIVPTEIVIDHAAFLKDPTYFMLYHVSEGLCPVKGQTLDDSWQWNNASKPNGASLLKADFDRYYDKSIDCTRQIAIRQNLLQNVTAGSCRKTYLQNLLKVCNSPEFLKRTALPHTVEFSFETLSPNMVPINKNKLPHDANCLGLTMRKAISPSSSRDYTKTRAATAATAAPKLQNFLDNGCYTVTTVGRYPRNNRALHHIQEMDFISMSRSLLPQGSPLWIRITQKMYNSIRLQAQSAGHEVQLPNVQWEDDRVDYLRAFYKLGGSSVDLPIEHNQVSVICIIGQENPSLVAIPVKILEDGRCVLYFDRPIDANHIFDFLHSTPRCA
jgi:hypothetical protein